jgi:ADP-ribose pyrophosphatase YjhB (NUDIX family)
LQANSLVPSVNVVVTNDAGEILLIRRTDNDNWAVPGGAIDLGESVSHAAIRETREESGIECEIRQRFLKRGRVFATDHRRRPLITIDSRTTRERPTTGFPPVADRSAVCDGCCVRTNVG